MRYRNYTGDPLLWPQQHQPWLFKTMNCVSDQKQGTFLRKVRTLNHIAQLANFSISKLDDRFKVAGGTSFPMENSNEKDADPF